jgi:hypothetical protein
MKTTLIAAALILSATSWADLLCPEPVIISRYTSCFISDPGCLKSEAEVGLIREGMAGCRERFPQSPCLALIERNEKTGFIFYCGLPQERAK